MRALLLVDVIKDFEHEDGDRLLSSFRDRHGGLTRALYDARRRATSSCLRTTEAACGT
jgi:hypothetical protein